MTAALREEVSCVSLFAHTLVIGRKRAWRGKPPPPLWCAVIQEPAEPFDGCFWCLNQGSNEDERRLI